MSALYMTNGLIQWYGLIAILEYLKPVKDTKSFYRFGAITKNEGLLGLRRILATRREKAEHNSSDLARKLSGLGPGDAPLGGQRRGAITPSWLGLISGPGRGFRISTSNHRFKGGGRAPNFWT